MDTRQLLDPQTTVMRPVASSMEFYSLLGFLAGYAEAWFIGTVDRVQRILA